MKLSMKRRAIMPRNYVVEEMEFTTDGSMIYSERPVERPITEEDEKGLVEGQYVLAAVMQDMRGVVMSNLSVLCKVMEITDDRVLIRKLAQR